MLPNSRAVGASVRRFRGITMPHGWDRAPSARRDGLSEDRGVEESAQMRADGARVLTEGLPALPVGITLSNETPVGSWQTEDYGFVAFVTGSPDGRSDIDPGIRFLQYERIHDEWIPMFPSTWW